MQPTKPKMLAIVAAAAAAAAAIVSSPTATAQSAPAPTANGSTISTIAPVLASPTTGSSRVKSYTPQQLSDLQKGSGDPAVAAYWTPSRQQNARSADLPADAKAVANALKLANPGPLTTVSRPQSGAAKPFASPATVTPVTNFSPTNGKIFFHNVSDGKDYACSGSAVNSGSRRLVITAGHCVYGAPGNAWHTNVVFIPKYYYGQRPYGTFAAYRLRTYTDWINNQDSWTGVGFNSDVAFITTYSGTYGGRVVDTVGGHGLSWGGGLGFDASIFGYPGNLSGGQAMWACWGHTGWRFVGFYQENSISGCNFGGGSSGGPWLDQYSNASGLGYVRSVTSNGPTDSAAYIDGPYFDGRLPGLFNAANADW